MKTIIVNHPTAEEILSLKELKELSFRIAEHLEEYWERKDGLTETKDEMYFLASRMEIVKNIAEKLAWRIDDILDTFGELPF